MTKVSDQVQNLGQSASTEDSQADDLTPANRTERRAALLAIYSQLTSSAQAYHSMIISLNVLLITANLLITGHISAISAGLSTRERLLAGLVPLVISFVGVVVTRVIHMHYSVITSVIRRIDEVNGVFIPGLYVADRALFPERWRDFGTPRWREIEFEIFLPLEIIVGSVAATVIVLH